MRAYIQTFIYAHTQDVSAYTYIYINKAYKHEYLIKYRLNVSAST